MPNIEQAKESIISRPITTSASLEESPGSWVRVKGVVESEQPIAAGFARIETKGSPAQLHYFSPGFSLKLASGQTIAVKIAGEVRFLPEEKKRGPWSQLEANEIYKPLSKRAPGPHIEVLGSHAVLRAGDSVAVFGQIEDDLTSASYRSHSKQLSALTVSSGSNAESLIAEWYEKIQRELQRASTPAPKGLLVKRLLLAAILLMLLFLGYRLFTWIPSAVATLSFILGLWFLIEYVTAEDLPPFYLYKPNETQEASKAPMLASIFFGLGIIPTLLPGLFITGFSSIMYIVWRIFDVSMTERERQESHTFSTWFCIVVFTSAFFHFLSYLLSFIAWRRFADLIRSAPSYDPQKPDAWSKLSGRLTDATPVEICGREAAVYFVEKTSTRSKIGSNKTSITTSNEQLSRENFLLDTPHGQIEVDPNDAIWTSTTTSEQTSQPGPDEKLTQKARILAQGSWVLAVGRVQDQKLASTGPQSLLLFADASNPNAALEQVVEKNIYALAKLAALVLGLSLVANYALFNLL